METADLSKESDSSTVEPTRTVLIDEELLFDVIRALVLLRNVVFDSWGPFNHQNPQDWRCRNRKLAINLITDLENQLPEKLLERLGK